MLSVYALACLPALTALTLAFAPSFYQVPVLLSGHGLGREIKGPAGAWILCACLLVIPAALLGFSTGASTALAAGCALSFAGALWGAYRLCGRVGVLAATAALVLAVSARTSVGVVAADVLAVCAGLGAAHLLNVVLSRRGLAIFLVAFAVIDVVVVGSGLVGSALTHLPLVGAFGLDAPHVVLFNRVQVGSTFLGSGDIAYAALAAALIVGFKLGWVRTLVVGGVYAAAALSLAALAVHSGQSVPATAPGLLAVLSAAALAEVRRRSLRNSGAVFNA